MPRRAAPPQELAASKDAQSKLKVFMSQSAPLTKQDKQDLDHSLKLIDAVYRRNRYLPPNMIAIIAHRVIQPFVRPGMFQPGGVVVASYTEDFPHRANPKDWVFSHRSSCQACLRHDRSCYQPKAIRGQRCSACTHEDEDCVFEGAPLAGARPNFEPEDADGDEDQVASLLMRVTAPPDDEHRPSTTPVKLTGGRSQVTPVESPKKAGKRRAVDVDEPEAGPSGLSHAEKRPRTSRSVSVVDTSRKRSTSVSGETNPSASTSAHASALPRDGHGELGSAMSGRTVFNVLGNNPDDLFVMTRIEFVPLSQVRMFKNLDAKFRE